MQPWRLQGNVRVLGGGGPGTEDGEVGRSNGVQVAWFSKVYRCASCFSWRYHRGRLTLGWR
jgi:hypothetical protein